MDGRLERLDDGQWQLRFVRRLRHAPEQVWRALVEPAEMEAWMPARMVGERRPGAVLRFVFPEAPEHESTGRMLMFEPPWLLEYTWEDEHLRFELRPIDEGCELTFLTRFDEVGKAARDAAGWHVCLDALERSLAGEAPDRKGDAAWRPLNQRYQRLFGPEASTIGPPDWHPEGQAEA